MIEPEHRVVGRDILIRHRRADRRMAAVMRLYREVLVAAGVVRAPSRLAEGGGDVVGYAKILQVLGNGRRRVAFGGVGEICAGIRRVGRRTRILRQGIARERRLLQQFGQGSRHVPVGERHILTAGDGPQRVLEVLQVHPVPRVEGVFVVHAPGLRQTVVAGEGKVACRHRPGVAP